MELGQKGKGRTFKLYHDVPERYKATEHMNEELIRMIKLRIQGLSAEVEKFTEQLKKDGYHFLMESDDYPNRNSEYVRRYVEVMLDEDQDQQVLQKTPSRPPQWYGTLPLYRAKAFMQRKQKADSC